MVKYIRRFEFVHDYRQIGAGRAGAKITSTIAGRQVSDASTHAHAATNARTLD